MNSIKLAESFLEFCKANPDQRFWQALRNWSGWSFVYVSDRRIDTPGMFDTFYRDTLGKEYVETKAS